MTRSQGEFQKAQITARDLKVGDYLDNTGRSRVHTVHEHNGRVLAGHKRRGAKAPGVSVYHPDEQIAVWRRPGRGVEGESSN